MGIQVASAPVSWGIMEEVEVPAEYPYSRVLDEIASAGYTGTELGPYGYLPPQPRQLETELKQRRLGLCSAFVAIHLGDGSQHKTGFEQVAKTSELISQLGAKILVLSDEITPERSGVAGRREEANRLSWSDAQWKDAQRAIEQVLAICRSRGLGVSFHHHVGSHVETPEEITRLLDTITDPELGLCLDTGHCAYGGGDPVAVVEKYGERITCLHLKDVNPDRLREARERKMNFHDAVRHGVFAPVGQGSVNFARIIELLNARGFAGWAVVEQDVLAGGRGAGDPLANAKAGRSFLRKLGV
jgi:inosose dehydratase